MFSAYTGPIKTAILLFPFLALLISAPILIFYYRKYGELGKFRSLVIYSFVFYLLTAYFLVILPLPSTEAVSQMTGPRMQLHLFQSEIDFFHQTVLRINDPSTYLPALKQSVFLEPIFNLALFLPLGVYCRYYFNFSWKKTVLISFCLSLFFELTQLSGLYFIYPRPYRLFDVDDLLHNTLGGGLGYVIAPLMTFFLPTRQELDLESLEDGKKVSLIRRTVAFLIDWFIIGIFFDTLPVLINLILPNPITNYLASVDNSLVFTLKVILYFILLTYFWQGKTFGKKIVKIQVMEENRSRVSLWGLIKRYGLFYLLMRYDLSIFNYSINQLATADSTGLIIYSGLAFISLGILLLFAFNLLYAFIRGKHRLFHEKASRTYTISTIREEGTNGEL